MPAPWQSRRPGRSEAETKTVRDILTALAGAVILILVAALTVPPLVAWESYRTLVDRTIGRSLGLDARTDGRIAVRLLPSPQLSVDRLRIGGQADKPALDLSLVKAEIGLTPLLTGEVRFTETRIGRAEIKLPISDDDAVRLPADLYQTLADQDLAIEDLSIGQVILTTVVPQSGRTDQVRAETVHLSAPRLLGPWRIEGTSGAVAFRIATGEPAEDGSIAVKFSGGGDTRPRFEADTRIRLEPVPGEAPAQGSQLRAMIPKAEGSARVVVGPPVQVAGAYLPFSLGGTFKARGPVVAVLRREGRNRSRRSGHATGRNRTNRSALLAGSTDPGGAPPRPRCLPDFNGRSGHAGARDAPRRIRTSDDGRSGPRPRKHRPRPRRMDESPAVRHVRPDGRPRASALLGDGAGQHRPHRIRRGRYATGPALHG